MHVSVVVKVFPFDVAGAAPSVRTADTESNINTFKFADKVEVRAQQSPCSMYSGCLMLRHIQQIRIANF